MSKGHKDGKGKHSLENCEQYRAAGVQNASWRVAGENANENYRPGCKGNLDAILRNVYSVFQTLRSHR